MPQLANNRLLNRNYSKSAQVAIEDLTQSSYSVSFNCFKYKYQFAKLVAFFFSAVTHNPYGIRYRISMRAGT